MFHCMCNATTITRTAAATTANITSPLHQQQRPQTMLLLLEGRMVESLLVSSDRPAIEAAYQSLAAVKTPDFLHVLLQIRLLSRILALQSEDPPTTTNAVEVARTYRQMAEAWIRVENHDQALRQLRHAHQLVPTCGETLEWMAWVHAHNGNPQAAVRVQEQALATLRQEQQQQQAAASALSSCSSSSSSSLLLNRLVQASLTLSVYHQSVGDVDRASSVLEKCDALTTADNGVLRARAYHQLGHLLVLKAQKAPPPKLRLGVPRRRVSTSNALARKAVENLTMAHTLFLLQRHQPTTGQLSNTHNNYYNNNTTATTILAPPRLPATVLPPVETAMQQVEDLLDHVKKTYGIMDWDEKDSSTAPTADTAFEEEDEDDDYMAYDDYMDHHHFDEDDDDGDALSQTEALCWGFLWMRLGRQPEALSWVTIVPQEQQQQQQLDEEQEWMVPAHGDLSHPSNNSKWKCLFPGPNSS